MRLQKLFAGAAALLIICGASSPAPAEDMPRMNDRGTRGFATSPRFAQVAFNDDEPKASDPTDSRGAKEQKPRRGPDDDFGGPGGPGFGPGGPKRGPGDLGGPGVRGRGPGRPDGDIGPPPPDGDRHGPGPRPGGDGSRHGPDGGRFEGFMHRPDPEMTEVLKKEIELSNQANDLAAQYQRAGSADKDKIQKQIEETVNKQFDVVQQRRKLQLDRMQKDLEDLRKLMESKNAARESLVKGRVQQLLNGGGFGF